MPSDAIWGMIRLYRQYGKGNLYIDNITVSTARMGTSDGGSTPPPAQDTSLPNAPTNLTVTQLWEDLKALASTVWQWIGPASAEAATASSDRVTILWDARPGQRFTFDLTAFAWSGAKSYPDIDAGLGRYVIALPNMPAGQAGDDRWICATERDGKALTGCNQLALGPIVLPPPPVPEPIPAPDPEPEPIGPATVTMSGDQIYIACDSTRYTRAKTTGTGTKRVITCLP
jgi:hypothetical protein